MKKFKEKFSGLTLIKILIYVFLGLFMLLPLFSVFLISFTDDPINIIGSFTDRAIFSETIEKLKGISLENYKNIFSNTGYLDALKNSLFLGFLVTFLVIVVCIPLAYGIARTKMPFKKTISALCMVPLIVPTFISAYAFIIMFGRAGWVTQIYNTLGGEVFFFFFFFFFG